MKRHSRKKKFDWARVFGAIGKNLWPVAAGITIMWYVFDIMGVTLRPPPNQPPTIQDGIRLSQEIVAVGGTISARVIVKDPNLPKDEINYSWAACEGRIGEQLDRFQGPAVIYIAPTIPGRDVITVIVYDREGETDKDFCIVTIKEAERLGSP